MRSTISLRNLALGLLSIPTSVLAAEAAAEANNAAEADLPSVTDGMTISSGTLTDVSELATPTGSYKTFTSKIDLTAATLDPAATGGDGTTVVGNGTSTTTGEDGQATTIVFQSATADITVISGKTSTTTTGTDTKTDTDANPTATGDEEEEPLPTNTRPCNNYPEFCSRKYSNITEICAHNSPFVGTANLASNQELGVTTQLNDGIRMLQAQIHFPSANSTIPHFCHTNCDILDAGPIETYLAEVRKWVASHPYDVITILLGNGPYSPPELYYPAIKASGILDFVYTPPHVPMALEDWPTLAQLILSGKRVVMFMDYETNPERFPWLLDQFSQMWETPFDPIDISFPCTVQRPPELSAEDAKNRLYMTNHNFNVDVTVFGAALLVPATTMLNQTNNVTGEGSLGEGAQRCVEDWGRPPNFLNVDYYNYGGFPGSVFEVAARMNNVTYNRECCGQADSVGVLAGGLPPSLAMVMGVVGLVSAVMAL